MKLSIMLDVKQIKKLIILIIGVSVLLIGLVLLFIPGPGILIIILGLVILAVEFIWAKKLLKKVKQYAKRKIL